MGESDCIVISIYYWIGLQQACVSPVCVCVCLCADLFKSIMFLRVCTVYAHRLTFSVPRLLSPLCLLLSPFVLTHSFLLCLLITISLFSSHFCFYLPPPPFIHSSTHLSIHLFILPPFSISVSLSLYSASDT